MILMASDSDRLSLQPCHVILKGTPENDTLESDIILFAIIVIFVTERLLEGVHVRSVDVRLGFAVGLVDERHDAGPGVPLADHFSWLRFFVAITENGEKCLSEVPNKPVNGEV